MESSVLSSSNAKKSSSSYVKKSSPAEVKVKAEEVGSEDKAWFCSLYQRNKCANKSSHSSVVKGKMRWAQHICATCYQKDNSKLGHPECFSACPHTGTGASARV